MSKAVKTIVESYSPELLEGFMRGIQFCLPDAEVSHSPGFTWLLIETDYEDGIEDNQTYTLTTEGITLSYTTTRAKP